MSYLALYRRFRPQTFDTLVGQDAVVKTLKNQIATGRIGHAYLFSGARGTGKTTAARIFARAINCLSPVDGSPCGKCAACVALAGGNIDVVEMDAASNNKVEEVRDLRENVQYPPVSCRYKVYIIDEVHMLTDAAFNALLKTLEEPPAHAVFLLATTEPQKLPATILSRCMRFDFRLLDTPKIADYVADIYRRVGKDFEEEAVYAIAKAGNGSMRDALSVADVCLSYGEGKLTYRDVTEVLGFADRDKTVALCETVLSGDEGAALSSADEILKSGKNVFLLAKEVVGVFRDLVVARKCASPERVLGYPKDDVQKLKKIADGADEKRMLRIIALFSELDGKMRYSAYPRTLFEAALLKAALPETDFDLAALLYRVNKLTEEVERLKAAGIAAAPVSGASGAVVAAPLAPDTAGSAGAAAPGAAGMLLDASAMRQNVSPAARQNPAAVAEAGAGAVQKTAPVPPKTQPKAPVFDVGEAPPEDFNFMPPPEDYPAEPRREKSEDFGSGSVSSGKVRQAFAPGAGYGFAGADAEPVRPAASAEPVRPAAPMKAVPKGRLFGTLVRALRSAGQNMLWVACADLDSQETDDRLTLIADDTTYQVLTKPANFETLKNVLAGISEKRLEVMKAGQKPDSFQTDVAALKRKFGEDLVTVKR